ncbi:serine/threonine-protein kinase [Chlorogloea sp. CCALA 695]|uniref:serine/threonine-protein kinase n=1 Tax=Chlorogloea sp. CCALA 695 TaxID=2107693 RepID=UPI000D083A0F|nr:serine/threonine-protein kinase [Chlorogloea sp. CCALA 695]PSB26668.1 serine/threonine protein kinase [Chlorogloea sp. CCALA 695]
MQCCLNPDCSLPLNPDNTKYCQNCGKHLATLKNRYYPIKFLGAGGFGRTYLAEDKDNLNELCVIKQLAPKLQSIQALQKAEQLFKQEAEKLKQLGGHPQIPTLFAYFEQDECLYLVQQYIQGQNLFQEMQKGGIFNEQKIRQLLNELLHILQFVHLHQVIHRDIKPENIMRCLPMSVLSPQQKLEGKERVSLVLIDFGIAKQLEQTNLTRGTNIGTYGYTAPEQLQKGKVYPASDLYSLGATCVHLLTGVSPHQLFQQQGYEWTLNWRKHLRSPISQQLELIIDKLLRQNYEQRYQSAEDVLSDLNTQSVPTEPITTQSSSSLTSPRQVTTPNQKPKFKKISLGLCSVLLVGVVGTQTYGYFQYKLSPFNQLFAITGMQSRLLLKNTISVAPNWVSSLAISSNQQTLATGNSDNTLGLWNLKTKEVKKISTGSSYPADPLAISPDVQTLISGTNNGELKIWNLNTGKLQKTLTGHSYPVNALAISSDGRTLVSASTDNAIAIWNLQSQAQKTIPSEHTDLINSLAISPNAQTLVSGSADNTIKVWNLQTGELDNTLLGHTGSVTSLAISPDTQILVSGSGDNTIKVWNLQTGELDNTFLGHTDSVTSLAISPDAQILVSGSSDNTIKVWNLQTGELDNTLLGHTYTIKLLNISPDQRTLVSGSYDGKLKIWQLP